MPMARTIEDVDRDLVELRRQVEQLLHREPDSQHPLRTMAGCFTGDPDWASIHSEIESGRREPDDAERA
jgi:hypothetical protein